MPSDPQAVHPQLTQARKSEMDTLLSGKLLQLAEDKRGFRSWRLRRAARSQRVLDRIRAEALTALVFETGLEPEEVVARVNELGVDKAFGEDFNWDEFLAFLEKLFELITKFFL